jgi:epoxyqueuosine reductase
VLSKTVIRDYALGLGFDACGFAAATESVAAKYFEQWLAQNFHGEMQYLARGSAKRINIQRVLPQARTVLSLAASYFSKGTRPDRAPQPEGAFAPESGVASGTGTAGEPIFRGVVARYAQFEDYHLVLGRRLEQLARFIHENAPAEARSIWYVDTGPVLERDLAERAGIGFIGKHTNVISRRLGNWIFLSELITTLELEPDPAEQNRCGTCTRCLAACPTQAIRAPFQLDARRCISYLTIELKGPIPLEFRRSVGNRIFGCDDCLAVCPWNRFAREGQLMKAYPQPGLDLPNLIDLLALTETEFQARFRTTPLARTKRRGLVRNVCVALGNVGNRTALQALARAGQDPDPLIAEHAQWASTEIESRAPQD